MSTLKSKPATRCAPVTRDGVQEPCVGELADHLPLRQKTAAAAAGAAGRRLLHQHAVGGSPWAFQELPARRRGRR